MGDRGLSVSLRQTAPIPLHAEFSCAAGSVLAIFGPSGAGKTTILRAIAGLDRPSHGVVRAGAHTWTDTASGAFVPPHRRPIGYVFQEYALFPHLSATGNVMAALSHRPRRERRSRAEALLAQVHLGDRLSRRPDELSGGERQRVALARALARDPAVLLLDEPFAAVDRAVRRKLQEDIGVLRRTLDIPLVLVTHDVDDVLRLATDVLLLERGRAVACGPVAALMSRPDLAFLRDAVGLGSVFEATVARILANRGLAELQFDGGTLLTAAGTWEPGAAVRVRIPAREVILATAVPGGLSLHNVLAGVISAIHRDPSSDHAIVETVVGNTSFLAEVTPDAVSTLGLAPGMAVYLLVKSVSIEVRRE